MGKTRKYQDFLLERLKDRKEAIAYLNAALEESLKDDEESQGIFLIALRNVVEAQGGIGNLAKKTGMGGKVSTKRYPKKATPNSVLFFL